jgi:hypothetical protein
MAPVFQSFQPLVGGRAGGLKKLKLCFSFPRPAESQWITLLLLGFGVTERIVCL